MRRAVHDMGRLGARVTPKTPPVEGAADMYLVTVEGEILVGNPDLAEEIVKEINHGITEARLRLRRRHGL